MLHFINTLPFLWQLAVLAVVFGVVTVGIAWVCNFFEDAADYLGRNMPPGVKGATYYAMGSSMPEFWTTMALLFFIVSPASFAAGISVTAGSAVFNGNIIPMLSIMAVMSPFLLRIATFGIVSVVAGEKISEIEIDRKAMLRDGIALIIAEAALIVVLGFETLTIWAGAGLVGLYIPYVLYMWWQAKNHTVEEAEEDDDEDDDGEPMTTGKAWRWLILSTGALVVLCFVLGEGIMESAHVMGVHPMVTALILGAAASSVPDTILSVKDALKGNYEDAVANAFGSNTFDICIALGLPLLIFTAVNGSIAMPTDADIQSLRIALLVVSTLTVMVLLIPRKIKLVHGFMMGLLYIAFVGYALNNELNWVTLPF